MIDASKPELADSLARRTVGPSPDKQMDDWLHLIRDRRWSLKQKLSLLDCLGSPAAINQSSLTQLQSMVAAPAAATLPTCRAADIANDRLWLQRPGHALITIADSRYPTQLKEIYNPPIALFAKGDLACLQTPQVAMVGSRRPTPVGTKVTVSLASDLARLGIVITSGMALGIDGAAHRGALEAGAPTIAVMGCGLDTIYPSRHRHLFADIAASGCLLSEYPPDFPPTRYNFPERNRIISGLSLGVVIIEAARRSGTIITARLAVEQNRELMVVPGSALSLQYEGSHRLIREGATIITSAEDILASLSTELHTAIGNVSMSPLSPPVTTSQGQREDALLSHIGFDSTSIDQIILTSGLTAAEVSSMLLMLEVEGVVAVADDGGYVKLC